MSDLITLLALGTLFCCALTLAGIMALVVREAFRRKE